MQATPPVLYTQKRYSTVLNICEEKFFRATRQDVFFVVFLLCIGIWFIFDSAPVGKNPAFDLCSYIKLAENPLSFFDPSITGIHAQRIFGPTVVWALHKTLNISIDAGFRAVSGISFLTFIFLFYSILRGAKVSPMVAFGTTVFIIISGWPVIYSLANVYQVSDAMTYPIMMIMIILTVKQRPDALFVVSLIGVLTRQTLFVLAVCSFLYLLYSQDKKWRNAIYLSFISMFFFLSTLFAGGSALTGLLTCTVTGGSFSNILIGLKETRLPLLFSPFLLVFFNRDILGYIKKYWWLFLYVTIAIGQPFLIYFEGLYDNAVRAIFQGIMPTFLLAGFIINGVMKQFPTKLIYCILPLAYGLSHHGFLMHTYPSLVGHRYVMILILGLWSWYLSFNTTVDRSPSS